MLHGPAHSASPAAAAAAIATGGGGGQPLVVTLNCLEDPSLEQDALSGAAAVEHAPLSALSAGRVESAAAVLLPSLAFLPRAAQRRLRPWQLLLCLGSPDRAADAAAAAELGLRLVHVDANRAEEVADTVMALFLGLLRRTHLLSRHASSSSSPAAGWLGSVQPLCRGMRRCRGLVLGIIGVNAAARCLATRSLAFRMSVLYFDPLYEVREMPNVLILPRSADYSEEVWMEIREKAIAILQSFLYDGVVPNNVISDEDEEISEMGCEDDQLGKQEKELALQICDGEQQTEESQLTTEYDKRRAISQPEEPQASAQSHSIGSRSEGRRSRSGKKGKKRPARRRSQQKMDELATVEGGSNYSSRRDDDNQVLSSSSRFASPEDTKNKQKSSAESPMEIISENKLPAGPGRKLPEKLKEGFVIALKTEDNLGFYVSRERVAGGGWYLDVIPNATKRDPAAQFLVTFKNKDTIGLRSFVAGGKLLQANNKMDLVFANHSFDVCESWMLEGSLSECCKLVNHKNSSAVLEVYFEILGAPSEEDGVIRWLD
nr:unnamed protein product [Digitaria exilis]